MSGLPETIAACRALLRDVTPMNRDCGTVCGAACCQPLEGEETGMLLFPGEDAYYTDRPGYAVRQTAMGPMLVCSGRCERDDRPLSCRLFPLLPVLRESGVRTVLDLRAHAVCPLAAYGKRGLRSDMAEAVQACGELLAADPVQRPFLAALTRQQDELKALRETFTGGKEHV